MLSHRRFSRPVLSTTQPSLRAKSILNPDADNILPRREAFVKKKKNKKFEKKRKKDLHFRKGCVILTKLIRSASEYPGVAKFGIALEWGSRGLEFESQHSDHGKVLKLQGFQDFSFFPKNP